METLNVLTEYYSSYDEDSRLRLPHGMVECLTTMRYIERYLRPGMRLLEIGAATGRCSHALAQRGYRVDAVELVDPVTFKASSDPAEWFQLYRREDIDGLMASFPVERLHYVGSDMATNYIRDGVDEMEDALFEMYLRYHSSICERADMVGMSHHILDIFRKK